MAAGVTSARGARWDAVLLAVLFVGFLIALTYHEWASQRITAPDQPSSWNTAPAGARALYLLLREQGYSVDRLETTWAGLRQDAGLLIVAEPLERTPSHAELAPLRSWIEAGGTILYLAAAPPRPADASDPVFGDVAVTAGTETPEVLTPSAASPYTVDVRSLALATPIRLAPNRTSYRALFADAYGDLVLDRDLGRGHVILVADARIASNGGIMKADNAVFMVDIAGAAIGRTGRAIEIDDYHHGVGFEVPAGEHGADTFALLPLPVRLAAILALLTGLLVLYNGNRRFGPLRTVPARAFRPRTELVQSMAHLFHRAGATELAIGVLYADFRAALSRRARVAGMQRASLLYAQARDLRAVDPASLERLADECEAASSGRRASEQDMIRIAQDLQTYTEKMTLDGHE